jgi:uncharacterized membrane protein YkoI
MTPRAATALLCLLCVLATPAHASEGDHERARRALEAGEVLPLGQVLALLEREYPGQVLEVELEQEHGTWIYEIKLLQDGGRVRKLEIDARSGALLRSRSKGTREVAR